MKVWIVMTDSPSQGGRVHGVYASREEAANAMKEFGEYGHYAYAELWTVGSTSYDAEYYDNEKNKFYNK